ncbi:MAG: helix-turn-helix domain-containing protein [bacterium]
MENLIDIRKLSELLGVKPATIYGWVYYSEIPFYKVGNLVRFNPKEIAEWLETRHCKSRKKQDFDYKALSDKL